MEVTPTKLQRQLAEIRAEVGEPFTVFYIDTDPTSPRLLFRFDDDFNVELEIPSFEEIPDIKRVAYIVKSKRGSYRANKAIDAARKELDAAEVPIENRILKWKV